MKAIAQATALAASNAMLTCSGCGGTLATGLAPHHVWDHSAVQALHRHRHRACRTRHGRAGDGGVDPNGYTATKQPMIGSCGNQWATATITRSWTHVKGGSRHDVWRVSYSGGFQTKNGAFITFPSPAACQQAPLDWPVGVSLSVGSTAGSTAPT